MMSLQSLPPHEKASSEERRTRLRKSPRKKRRKFINVRRGKILLHPLLKNTSKEEGSKSNRGEKGPLKFHYYAAALLPAKSGIRLKGGKEAFFHVSRGFFGENAAPLGQFPFFHSPAVDSGSDTNSAPKGLSGRRFWVL